MSRRWFPWRRRIKGALDLLPDVPSGFGDDPISAIITVFFLILAIPFVVIAIISGAELLLLLLLFPFVVLARVLFGRHWIVEARKGWTIHWDTPAGDWQASGVTIHEVAAAIQHGTPPPKTCGQDAVER